MAFADDITVGCCERDKKVLISKLRVVLEKTYFWMDSKRLVINVDKYFVFFFLPGRKCPSRGELC